MTGPEEAWELQMSTLKGEQMPWRPWNNTMASHLMVLFSVHSVKMAVKVASAKKNIYCLNTHPCFCFLRETNEHPTCNITNWHTEATNAGVCEVLNLTTTPHVIRLVGHVVMYCCFQSKQRWWGNEQRSRWLWRHAERTWRTWCRRTARTGARWAWWRQTATVSRGTWRPVRRLQCQGMFSHRCQVPSCDCLICHLILIFFLLRWIPAKPEALPTLPCHFVKGCYKCAEFYTCCLLMWLKKNVSTSPFKCAEVFFYWYFYLFFFFSIFLMKVVMAVGKSELGCPSSTL